MDIAKIEWESKTKEKVIKKHGFTIHEVEEVFQGDKRIKAHAGVYVALGASISGKYLVVVFRKQSNDSIKIITARKMTKSEKKQYRS